MGDPGRQRGEVAANLDFPDAGRASSNRDVDHHVPCSHGGLIDWRPQTGLGRKQRGQPPKVRKVNERQRATPAARGGGRSG